MRMVGTLLVFAVLIAGLTLFYLIGLDPASSSSHGKSGAAGLPEEVSLILDAGGRRVLNPISTKKSDAMTASERKTLMHTIKTIDDPLPIAQ
jgi:hypothetical protein